MSEIEKIKSFLDTVGYDEKRCQCLDFEKGQNPFITISRQAGAGGHSLANALLEEIKKRRDPVFQNWQLCNQEICRKVLDMPGINTTLERLLRREYHSPIQDMVHEIMLGHSSQDAVIKKMFEVILALAAAGKVILVGRGGSFLTKHLPLGVHVRLVAPLAQRVAWMVMFMKVTEKKAKEIISEQDQARAKLIKNYFNKDINNPEEYDLVFNSGTVPMEDMVRTILDLVDARICHCRKEAGMVQGAGKAG